MPPTCSNTLLGRRLRTLPSASAFSRATASAFSRLRSALLDSGSAAPVRAGVTADVETPDETDASSRRIGEPGLRAAKKPCEAALALLGLREAGERSGGVPMLGSCCANVGGASALPARPAAAGERGEPGEAALGGSGAKTAAEAPPPLLPMGES